MDDTEITNNEYRQFVFWVRDSIARKLLGETYTDFVITEDQNEVPLEKPIINWEEKIDWKDPEMKLAMNDIYIPENEQMTFTKEVDSGN
ncbi:MAG: hypothetical protein IPF54_26400 [Draconibacterium sp.]|nr:hypothetical protein [Draconibacterium sp.]